VVIIGNTGKYLEPVSGKGVYYIYYMPYRNEGGAIIPKGCIGGRYYASAEWLARAKPGLANNCTVITMQSV